VPLTLVTQANIQTRIVAFVEMETTWRLQNAATAPFVMTHKNMSCSVIPMLVVTAITTDTLCAVVIIMKVTTSPWIGEIAWDVERIIPVWSVMWDKGLPVSISLMMCGIRPVLTSNIAQSVGRLWRLIQNRLHILVRESFSVRNVRSQDGPLWPVVVEWFYSIWLALH
jgi:hypothetical protein